MEDNLPQTWTTLTVDQIKAQSGAAIAIGPFGSRMKADLYVTKGIPVIRGTNISGTKKFKGDFVYISEKKAEELKSSNVYNGDLVFPHRGSIGEVGIITGGNDAHYIISSSLMKLTLNSELAEPLFLFYYFRSDIGRHELLKNASQVGTPGIATPLTSLKSIRVPVPPLPEQRAIAGILGALDDKIEVNRRMNATLESMARAVFRQWFVENEEAKNWGESSLEELFGKRNGCVLTGPFGSNLHAHDYRVEGTPLILVKHVMDGRILEDRLPLVGEHKLSEMKRYLLEVGDIVFTRVGAVGRSAYIHARHKGWLISGQTLRVRVPDKKKLNPRYLAQIYLEQSFIDMVEQHALGTTRPSLNTSILSTFKFVLPPIELQNRFAEFAESLDSKVQQNLDESRTLGSLRDSLLPKLMRGEVRVKDVEK